MIRRLDTCDYTTAPHTKDARKCKAQTWCEITSAGRPMCGACKIELFFSELLYAPVKYILMPWQRKVLRDLYGTVVPENGERQYRHGYISVAKQNGKTFLLGGLPLFHMLMEADLEPNPEVYGCASTKDQGGLVFKAAAMLVRANPSLLKFLRIRESLKVIQLKDGRGFYAVVSADGDVQDGIRPSLLLRDELHRWKSAKAKTLLDVTTKGQKSREHPLDLAVTTAGAEYDSPIWAAEYAQAKKIISGAVQAPSYYAAIWEPDLKRIHDDPEYWKSREARVAANPSHEDNGGFLKDAAILDGLEKALAQPAEKSGYLRYDLNCPVTQEEEPVIDMVRWRECGGSEDLGDWPTYDVDLLIRKWGLLEKECYAGIDASWTTDLTASVLVFPPFKAREETKDAPAAPGCEQYTLLAFFWMPEDRVEPLERICRVPLRLWVEQGFITATAGSVIDQRSVMDRIRWARQMFDLREMPYDRLNFRSEALNLIDEGVVAPEVPQTFLGLSFATKFLLAEYLRGNFRHGNNPVLNWMASCLQLQADQKDNCQPKKPDRKRSASRIDGIQAVITALSRVVVAPNVSGEIEVW